jgi:acyl-CoA reductase-like NAD-dependent aldehyde dehydrogenase
MRKLAAHERRALCTRIANGIAARSDELAHTISAEAGKPIGISRGEVARGVQTFAFAAEEAWRLTHESIHLDAVPTGAGRHGIVRRFPVGLVAAVSPFNFPLNLVAHKLAPAFATGCPVVLKPASATPLTSMMLAEICAEAGLPAGGLNVVPCSRAAAAPLTTDDRFKLLSFTGSPAVGWDMKARAGKKKVVLELGGNASVIVDKDADLDKAARRTAVGAFVYAGQICISVQRVHVHANVYDAFKERLLTATAALGIGDPSDEATQCGPLIDEKNAERIVAWIDEAKAAGADVLCGGERDGSVVKPCVLENVAGDSRLWCAEAFGPVCSLTRFATIDEAIAQVNDSAYGLQAGVFTDSVKHLWACFEGLEVGGIMHNDFPTFRVDHMPYGGVKDSGFGREGVGFAIEDYTELRHLALMPGGIPG